MDFINAKETTEEAQEGFTPNIDSNEIKNVDETRPISVRHGEGSRTSAAVVFSGVSMMILGQSESIRWRCVGG